MVEAKLLPLELLRPNPRQPRVVVEDEDLQELAEDIAQNGLIEPIVARPLPDGTYEIVAGERRYRAARLAGLSEVPVVVREVSPEEVPLLSLAENAHRKDMSRLERVVAVLRLLKDRFPHVDLEELFKVFSQYRYPSAAGPVVQYFLRLCEASRVSPEYVRVDFVRFRKFFGPEGVALLVRHRFSPGFLASLERAAKAVDFDPEADPQARELREVLEGATRGELPLEEAEARALYLSSALADRKKVGASTGKKEKGKARRGRTALDSRDLEAAARFLGASRVLSLLESLKERISRLERFLLEEHLPQKALEVLAATVELKGELDEREASTGGLVHPGELTERLQERFALERGAHSRAAEVLGLLDDTLLFLQGLLSGETPKERPRVRLFSRLPWRYPVSVAEVYLWLHENRQAYAERLASGKEPFTLDAAGVYHPAVLQQMRFLRKLPVARDGFLYQVLGPFFEGMERKKLTLRPERARAETTRLLAFLAPLLGPDPSAYDFEGLGLGEEAAPTGGEDSGEGASSGDAAPGPEASSELRAGSKVPPPSELGGLEGEGSGDSSPGPEASSEPEEGYGRAGLGGSSGTEGAGLEGFKGEGAEGEGSGLEDSEGEGSEGSPSGRAGEELSGLEGSASDLVDWEALEPSGADPLPSGFPDSTSGSAGLGPEASGEAPGSGLSGRAGEEGKRSRNA